MNGFIWGVLGVIFALALIVGCLLAGWALNDFYHRKARDTVRRERSAEEERRAREEAAAFQVMVNYNADIAYGVTPAPGADDVALPD